MLRSVVGEVGRGLNGKVDQNFCGAGYWYEGRIGSSGHFIWCCSGWRGAGTYIRTSGSSHAAVAAQFLGRPAATLF